MPFWLGGRKKRNSYNLQGNMRPLCISLDWHPSESVTVRAAYLKGLRCPDPIRHGDERKLCIKSCGVGEYSELCYFVAGKLAQSRYDMQPDHKAGHRSHLKRNMRHCKRKNLPLRTAEHRKCNVGESAKRLVGYVLPAFRGVVVTSLRRATDIRPCVNSTRQVLGLATPKP